MASARTAAKTQNLDIRMNFLPVEKRLERLKFSSAKADRVPGLSISNTVRINFNFFWVRYLRTELLVQSLGGTAGVQPFVTICPERSNRPKSRPGYGFFGACDRAVDGGTFPLSLR